ncbi:MAG: hypothetical protein MUE44_01905 [Oscillatoriaceae cyanobacterium Prado104]|jgi:hypothetical protein|nr:hypothetical protein [Oscillatoriaceae cyanobacterium Prado104]
MSEESANAMRVKFDVKEGVFKGKELEGKLDIKVNVDAVTDKPKDKPKPSLFTWEMFLLALIVALATNHASGDPAGIKHYQKIQRIPQEQAL